MKIKEAIDKLDGFFLAYNLFEDKVDVGVLKEDSNGDFKLKEFKEHDEVLEYAVAIDLAKQALINLLEKENEDSTAW